MPAELWSEID